MSLQRSQPDRVAELQADLQAWTRQQGQFERALELRKQATQLRFEVSKLEQQVSDEEARLNEARNAFSAAAESVARSTADLEAAKALQKNTAPVLDAIFAVRALEAQLDASEHEPVLDTPNFQELERVSGQMCVTC